MFVFGNSTWRYGVWSVAWFPHVLYRLWPIGVAARHLEILTKRCRTLLAWLWPCERAGTSLLDVHCYFMVVAMWKEGNESSLMCIEITLLWPCDREWGGSLVLKWFYIWLWACGIKERIFFWCILYIYIYIYIYIYMVDLYIIMCYLFNSPYLLVVGDDRVCGTREQMIL